MQKVKVIDYIEDIPFGGVILGNKFRDNIVIQNNDEDYCITIEIDLTDNEISTIDNRFVVEHGTRIFNGKKVVSANRFISGYVDEGKMYRIVRYGHDFRSKRRYKSFEKGLGDGSAKLSYPGHWNSRFHYVSYHGNLHEPDYPEQLILTHMSTLYAYYKNVKVLNFSAMLDVIDECGTRIKYPITFEIPEKEVIAIVNHRQHVIRREGTLYKEPYQRNNVPHRKYVLPFEIKIDDELRRDIIKIFRRINMRIKRINGFLQRNRAKSSIITDGVYGGVLNGSSTIYGRKTTARISESNNAFDDIIRIIEDNR